MSSDNVDNKIVPLVPDFHMGTIPVIGFSVSFNHIFSTELIFSGSASSMRGRAGIIGLKNENYVGEGNSLFQHIFDNSKDVYFDSYSGVLPFNKTLNCPDILADIMYDFLPLSVIFGDSNIEIVNNSSNKTKYEDRHYLMLNHYFCNSSGANIVNFSQCLLEKFDNERKEVGKIIAAALCTDDYFHEVMSNFSHFIMANEIVAYYLDNGDNFTIGDFSYSKNKDFVRNVYDKFNDLTFTVHEYTKPLAEVMVSVEKKSCRTFDYSSDHKLTLNNLFYKYGVYNFSAFDFITLSSGEGNKEVGIVPEDNKDAYDFIHYLYDNKVGFLGKNPPLELVTFSQGSYLEIRNILLNNQDKITSISKEETVNFYNNFVSSAEATKAYNNDNNEISLIGIYCVIAFIIIRIEKNNDFSSVFLDEVTELATTDEDIILPSPDQWRYIIESFIRNNGEIPLRLVFSTIMQSYC